MLRYTQKQHFLLWLITVAATFLLGIAAAHLLPTGAHIAILLVSFFAVLLFTQLMLALLLRRALKTHFYSYASVALMGGILFEGVFVISVVGYLLVAIGKPGILTQAYLSEIFLLFPRRFSYMATLLISALSVAVFLSNIVLMRREGFHPKNALGAVLGGLYFVTTVGIYFLTDYLRDTVYATKTGFDAPVAAGIYIFLSLTLLVTLCYFECAFLGFVCMGILAVRRKPEKDKDFVIIPGCQIRRDGTLTPLLQGRVDRAVRFMQEQQQEGKPAPRLIPAGGCGTDETVSEGEAMAAYLRKSGIAPGSVLPECASRTTAENMKNAKAIAEANTGANAAGRVKYAFSTTNYHVFRSGICATNANMDAEGMASNTKWYFWPNGAIREFFAVLKLNAPAHIKAVSIIAIICAAIGVMTVLGYLG